MLLLNATTPQETKTISSLTFQTAMRTVSEGHFEKDRGAVLSILSLSLYTNSQFSDKHSAKAQD